VSSLTIRPLARDEAALAADLMTAAFPREPQDPVLTAYRWARPRAGWTHGRFVAEVDGAPAAYLEWQHGAWEQLPERHCWVEVWLDLARMDEGLMDELWAWIEGAAAAEGALTLNAACGEDEPEMLKVLVAHDYVKKRTDRVWTLDLTRHGEKITADAKAALDRMHSAGIKLTTLDRWLDPQRFRKLHQLNELMRQDMPHSSPILPQTLDDFMSRVESPSTPPARWWVALDGGGSPVAMSHLAYPPVRGPVWTAFTGCHPDFRGRGIARAVKLQSLAQAVELGTDEVRTDNDSENAPMLHINETLGYELMPGYVSFEKRLPVRPLR
jgi:GNAT superfamily N-acetyltransferase